MELSSDIVFLVHRQNLKGFERCSVSNFEIDKPVPWIHPDSKGNRRFKVMWVLRVLKIFPNMLDQRNCLHTKQKSWSCTDLQLHFPFHSFSHLSWGEFFLSLCVMSWITSMNIGCTRSLSMFARQNLKTWAVCYYCYLQLILWIQLSLRIISMQRLQERIETKAKTRWQQNSFASIFFKVDLLGDVFF